MGEAESDKPLLDLPTEQPLPGGQPEDNEGGEQAVGAGEEDTYVTEEAAGPGVAIEYEMLQHLTDQLEVEPARFSILFDALSKSNEMSACVHLFS
eukprot:CAMPEP_0197860758 /NCGR_PEP_ID=MMETSP1438-20131217/36360_1 /TAXON_ID=1461541 /ORGANISM="Pterosperma sp., Strain CCMP1384" /LENGTH=94 /DNA_ID=CAMNT_0043477737 /DNA_START=231 /DNA_END=511 /DNA_ORIENTATION=+